MKTQTTTGTLQVGVVKYDGGFSGASLRLYLTNKVQFWLNPCAKKQKLAFQAPAEAIWTLVKTESEVVVWCNGVEIVQYSFQDGSCLKKWGGDVVEFVRFNSDLNTALALYRAGKFGTLSTSEHYSLYQPFGSKFISSTL